MKRSAIHHRQVALGARLSVEAGWECVETFGSVEEELRRARSSVVVVDLSALGKLLLRGAGLDEWIARSGSARVPVGQVAMSPHGGRICRLTDEDALVLVAPGETADVVQAIGRSIATEHAADRCLHLVDMTSGRTGFGVVGPRSRDVLMKLTALDVNEERMPDGDCAQASFAKVAATIVRQDVSGVLAYEVYVARDLGEYVWDAVLDAGLEFGAQPCGRAAYSRLIPSFAAA